MAVATPTLPASTSPVTNNTGQYVAVNIAGGTVTSVNVNGTQVATGTGVNVSLPPGASLAITYSVAPTMTWTDPLELGYTPGYSQENTGAEGPGYNPVTAMPLPSHSQGGFSGLGVGVSN
jgi:hypothetical protein